MDESLAWLRQAVADRMAAERFTEGSAGGTRCHVLAKCQQAVEKAVKAVVVVLREAGMHNNQINAKHNVERFMRVLIRTPRGTPKTIQQRLTALFDENTRAGLRALDALVPRWPGPGERPRRNTEYPFQDAEANWTFPAAENSFLPGEVERFRQLAHRLVDGAHGIVAAVRRGPK